MSMPIMGPSGALFVVALTESGGGVVAAHLRLELPGVGAEGRMYHALKSSAEELAAFYDDVSHWARRSWQMTELCLEDMTTVQASLKF